MRVRTPATSIFAVVVIGLALCHAIVAAPQIATSPYTEAIDLYRGGLEQLALEKLAGVMSDEIARQRDALLSAVSHRNTAESERAAAMIRGAVMLHTARAFAAFERNNNGEFRYHLMFAQGYVEKLASLESQAPFVRTWPLLVLALLQEGRSLVSAEQFGHHARNSRGDSPEFLLALGATEEMGWWIHHEEDADPGVRGDLKDAERDYRQAIIVAPTLIEARLRLGRVLTLRGDPEGMKILGHIGESSEVPLQYLARLFEGDVLEKRGDIAEAERRYTTAVTLLPTGQSACLALAHLRHARGARSEAEQDIRSSARATDVPDTSDPWFWYARGTAWRGPGYLEQLRVMIRK
ncbi:MAG: tetratricopeptide repeat protein [Vicinamibacterales bacterium]